MNLQVESERLATPQETIDKNIVVARTDGLGARLLAIVNGISLASILGASFKFAWQTRGNTAAQFHAIAAAKDMFAAGFLEKHFLASFDDAGYSRMSLSKQTLKQLREQLALEERRGWFISGLEDIDSILLKGGALSQAEAFSLIKFHPDAQKYIDFAYQLTLPDNPAAIHLRAGDLIYGPHRHRGEFTNKAISVPVAKRIIEKLQKDGYSIILYGQDSETISYLQKEYSVFLADDFELPGDTADHQKALFEIALMSRCQLIVAGDSRFAEIASKMASVKIHEPRKFFRGREQSSIIIDDLNVNAEKYTSLQTAFAYWSAFYWGREKLDSESIDHVLSKAVSFDPQNGFYAMNRLFSAVENMAYSRCESILESAFRNASLNGSILNDYVIKAAFIRRVSNKKRYYFQPKFNFVFSVKGDYPYIKLFSAILRVQIMQDADGAAIDLACALQHGVDKDIHRKLELEMGVTS
ncbi:hypothetical protein [Bordetella muralis]|uniref:hypothetical protein n=1 Tax=Bordetella muralis TaxID=1649130 RepID=UPI0039EE086A